MAQYYDVVLALIPLSLLGVPSILSIGGIGLTVAVSLGASISMLCILHALFVNVPGEFDTNQSTTVPSSTSNSAPSPPGINAD